MSSRIVVFCHSCCSFSYESRLNMPPNSGPTFCQRTFCRPSTVNQLEEIPASIEGSSRLQAIIVELINSRVVARPRIATALTSGLRTLDIILAVEIIKLKGGAIQDQQICAICSDDFQTCNSSHLHECSPNTTYNDNGMKLPCGHIFHESCILSWLTNHQTCPYCRYKIGHCEVVPTPEMLAEIYSEDQLVNKIAFALSNNSCLTASNMDYTLTPTSKNKINVYLDPSSSIPILRWKKFQLSIRLHELIAML